MSLIGKANGLLWLWVLFAIALGILVPATARLAPFAVLLLAGIVGGVAATLDLHGFRLQRIRPLAPWVLAHVLMIAWAWALGHVLGLSPVHRAGLLLLGASTPDLTAPLLSRLSRGATHAVVILLMVTGILSLLLLPLSANLLIKDGLHVPIHEPVRVLLFGVIIPTALGITVHHLLLGRSPASQEPAALVSTVSTVLVTAMIAGMNRETILSASAAYLVPVAGASALLLLGGLLLGRLAGLGAPASVQNGCLFIPGTREYALAAALVIAIGLPPEAALIPLVFGGLQMVLAPLIARRLGKAANEDDGADRQDKK